MLQALLAQVAPWAAQAPAPWAEGHHRWVVHQETDIWEVVQWEVPHQGAVDLVQGVTSTPESGRFAQFEGKQSIGVD